MCYKMIQKTKQGYAVRHTVHFSDLKAGGLPIATSHAQEGTPAGYKSHYVTLTLVTKWEKT